MDSYRYSYWESILQEIQHVQLCLLKIPPDSNKNVVKDSYQNCFIDSDQDFSKDSYRGFPYQSVRILEKSQDGDHTGVAPGIQSKIPRGILF